MQGPTYCPKTFYSAYIGNQAKISSSQAGSFAETKKKPPLTNNFTSNSGAGPEIKTSQT